MPSAIPIYCTEAFNWLFDQLNKTHFCHILQSTPQYSGIIRVVTTGGFQLNEKTLTMRKDIIFRSLSRLSDSGIAIVNSVIFSDGPWKEVHELLASIKEDLLRENWRNIILSAKEPGIVILALLKFQTDKWHYRLGRRLLKTPSAWKGCDDSVRQTNDHFLELVNSARTVFAGKESPVNAQPANNGKSVSDDDLRQLLEKEYKRGRAEQEKKTADDKREREAKLKETTRLLQQSQEENKHLEEEIVAVRQAMEQEKREMLNRVESLHNDSVRQLMEQMFLVDHDLQFEATKAQIDTDCLLDKLAQATAAQTALNQNSGSRHSLREQRRKLQEAIEELKLVQQDSVISVKGVPELLREADQQLLRIDSALKEDDAITSLACSQLMAFINEIKLDSQAENELNSALKFVRDAYEHELLHEGEEEMLEDYIKRKKGMLKNTSIMSALNNSLKTLETPAPARTREIWNLALDIPILKSVTLVIDACNAILRSDVWKKMTENYTFEQAKQHFIESCVSKRQCFQAINIVFDGTNIVQTSEKFADNVTVIFAAQKDEEHNADNAIIEMLPRLKESDGANLVWVATDDYGLRYKLEGNCDAFVRTTAIPQFFLVK